MGNKIGELFVLIGVAAVATAITLRPQSAKIVSSALHGLAENIYAATGQPAGGK